MATDTRIHDEVNLAVKKMMITESRLSLDPAELGDAEQLNGPVLRVTSVGLLGMFIRLEDELALTLPDGLFAGKNFGTVADLVDVLVPACAQQRGAA
ncbi:acyl carrier protein [Amycolatopsis sp. NBC_00345]|uniref:acyl carrier protein n=1 Tax=Amycolatopsis sp. NBC_00345 TaxID=2975955 RepID=UPI002E26F6E6